MDRKQAFTFAEIIVTILIIGVISAVTIPGLRQNVLQNTYAENLKKIYSELNAASTRYLADQSVNNFCRTDAMNNSQEDFEKNFIMPYFNVLTTCTAGDTSKCFGKSEILLDSQKSYLLNNGIAVAFDTADSKFKCSNNAVTIYISVDVNGPKSPNKGGVDQYMFTFTEKATEEPADGATLNECNKYRKANNEISAAMVCSTAIQKNGWRYTK